MTIKFSISNLVTIALLVLVAYVAYNARQVLLVGVFGTVLAYMLNPLVEKLISFKISRIIATLLVVAAAAILCFLVGVALIPSLTHDLVDFVQKLPNYLTWVIAQLGQVGQKLDIDLSSTAIYAYAMSWLKSSSSTILNWMGGVAGAMQYAFSITMNIVVVPVVAFLLLIDYTMTIKFLDKYLGTGTDSGIRKYITLFSETIASYFRGQLIVVLILCCLYSLVLKIIGLDSWLLLGVTTGFLSLIPYLGFATGGTLSILMAAMQFQDFPHPLMVVAGYAVVQSLESFVITPRIVGQSVGLHPVAAIFALLTGGAAFGFLGLLFAIPVTAFLFKLYVDKFARLVNHDFVDYQLTDNELEDGALTVTNLIEMREESDNILTDETLSITDMIARREASDNDLESLENLSASTQDKPKTKPNKQKGGKK